MRPYHFGGPTPRIRAEAPGDHGRRIACIQVDAGRIYALCTDGTVWFRDTDPRPNEIGVNKDKQLDWLPVRPIPKRRVS